MRKQAVEPVFGIIKSAIGFTRFCLRGLVNAASEWSLATLVYNCRRIARLKAAERAKPTLSAACNLSSGNPDLTGC